MTSGEQSQADKDRAILAAYEPEFRAFRIKEWSKNVGKFILEGLSASTPEAAMARAMHDMQTQKTTKS